MMKRIIALLLALILTVGLLPTVALAAEGENPTTDSGSVTKEASKDNLNLVKTVTKERDNYKVTLESWATGTVTSSSTPVPMDIILLLDQSGSMKKNFTSSSTETYNNLNKKNKKIYADYRNNCYIKSGNQYLKVTVTYQWEFGFSNDVYTYTWNGGSHTSTGGNSKPKIPLFYKSTTNSSTTRIAALKTAVSSFINKVNTEATTKNVDHRVAVVGFASTRSDYYENTELLSTPDVVNYGSANNIDYRNALVSAKTNKNKLDTAINRLAASGDTYPEYGFDMANQIFAQYPIQAGENRQRVVIMFTDGYPAPANTDNFNAGMANNAINNAKRCKDNNAKVYTIGIFDGADPSASIENYLQNQGVAANRYMHFSSSNYPSAMALNNGGTRGEGNFYFAASNADALNDIFDTISEEISTDTTELDGSATIIDNIPGNFAIPEGAQDITLKVAEFQKGGTFATATAAPTTVTAEHKDGTVTVTGFNFSDEWCGLDENDRPHGSKLIIEFTIHHNNYGGTQPTNAGASIKDKEGNEVIKVDDPAIPVKITEPSITGASATKVYDGTGIDVLENVAVEADKLVTGENEGKNAFVDIIVKVKDANNVEYTYTIPAGATTGSWDKENVEFKTPADVKIESDGSVGKYSYDLSITYQDKSQTNPADTKTVTVKAEYTITKRPVTLTSGSDEKKYDGTPLTKHEVTASTGEGVGFVGGDGATYTFTGSQTEPGESDNEFEYTLIGETKATNYEITKQLGKLKVTKDDTEITVTIIGKQETKEYNGQTQTVTGFDYTVTGAEKNDVTVTLNQSGKDSASGKDVTTANEGKYMMGLTASDFNVSSTKYSNVTITTVNDGWLKITPIAITLRSGDASKTYDGTALTNTTVNETGAFVTGEGLTYNVTGSQTEVGTSKNTYTYTPKTGTTLTNYTITKEEGDLTVTLPDLTALPTVTVDCINSDVSHSDKTDITLTAATQYELGDPQKVTNEIAYTRTITLTDAGKEYCIGEYNKDIAGHTEAAGGTTTITLKYSKEGSEWAWRATRANFLVNVQCNTPTVNVNLGNYIKKTLTGTNFHENFEATFTVEVTYTDDNDSGTATGSVRFTGADTKDFGFVSTVELKKNHVYKFTATELADNVPGVDYDTRTYSFALKITAEGDVVFGSVVEGVFVADKTDNKYVTITNTYTKPAYKIEKNVITDTSVKIPAWSLDYPDPVEIKVVVDADQQEIVLGYVIKITGSAGASFTLTEDEGSQFVTVHNADGEFTTVTPGKKLSFTLTQDHGNEHPILIYTTKVISRDPETGAFPAKVKNVVTEEDDTTHESGETTIEERGTLTVDFGALVRKHLTVTGDKSFNGATFTVNFTDGTFIKNEKENEPEISSVEVYAADAGVNERGLPNLTASVTYGADERDAGYKPFDGADLTIRVEGTYFYLVSEVIPDGATGYDTNEYIIGISVENDGDHLKVARVGYSKYIENSQEDPVITWNEGPTFYNTIDTGKDDYYPIIIPTIINKDTGMLNKTDHFAYVIGYPDGTVHPNGQITRAEVATIFFRLLRDEVRDGAFTTSNTYSDVAYGKWYNNPISTMSALGIITGYPDGTFKPNKPITRAEFAAIAARFDETQSGKSATFSDVIGHWAAKEIGIAYYNDWIKGYPDGTFKPDQNITRAEAMTLINRVLERKPESPADLLTNMNKWTDNLDTSKWYYLDVQEATNSHGYTRKTFNYELWRQMLPDPDWSRYER